VSSTLNLMISKAQTVGIVSHDAGGANILNAMIKYFPETDFHCFLSGPAIKIIDAHNVQFSADEADFFGKVDLVLCGTGSTSYEKKLLRKAKQRSLPTAAFIDHFVNYRDRFVLNGKVVFPDFCFVCDLYSIELAKKELAPYKKIYLCENYLVSYLCSEITAMAEPENNSVLYILENIEEDWGGEALPWEVAFNNFYDNFYKISQFDKIIVRAHPKDEPSIYQSLKKYKEVTFDYDVSPVISMSKVSTVVGVESYFLYLAHHCGLSVYTSLPNKIRLPRLPPSVYKKFGS
jgi:hypothetical protein